jgi:hypothetical protein
VCALALLLPAILRGFRVCGRLTAPFVRPHKRYAHFGKRSAARFEFKNLKVVRSMHKDPNPKAE